MPSLSWETLRLIALVIVLVPVLIANLRSGDVPNWGSVAVMVAGVALFLVRGEPSNAPWLFWVAGAVIWIGLFAALRLPGGVVKMAIAFLTWFDDAGAYLVFFTAAMLIVAVVAFALRRQRVPVAPGFLIAGLGVFALAATG